MFKLVISDDEGKTTVVPLVRDEITIGRKEGNTIRLTERNVSRRHARLQKQDVGYTIEDLGSYNGVKINGRRIDAETQTPLSAGDQVTIGDYVIALQSEAATEAMPAPPTGMEPLPPARLVMLTPPAPGAEFALQRDGMRIGRAEDLEIWINHRSISREHAVVKMEGDQIKIVDLESANGMRLNGKDVGECILGSGDVLELGQVRFRFVGEGEAYVFEADRTVQMDAVDLPTPEESGPNRTTILAAAAIVLVAIIVGAAIALGGGDDPPEPEITVENDPNGNTEVPETNNNNGPTPEDAANIAIGECHTALANDDPATALAAANRALELHPTSAGAARCKAEAEEAGAAEATFARGLQALEAEEYDTAYFAFEELPDESPLRERDEVAEARRGYIDSNLAQAEAALAESPAEAERFANNVLTLPTLSRDDERRANSILRQARGGSGGGSMSSGMGMRVSMSMRDTPPDTMTMEEAMSSSGGPVNVQEVMRGCSYNQRCIARELRGRANTAPAMGILIEAYKSIGDQGSARRYMQELVRRWPGSRQANTYRRQLGN